MHFHAILVFLLLLLIQNSSTTTNKAARKRNQDKHKELKRPFDHRKQFYDFKGRAPFSFEYLTSDSSSLSNDLEIMLKIARAYALDYTYKYHTICSHEEDNSIEDFLKLVCENDLIKGDTVWSSVYENVFCSAIESFFSSEVNVIVENAWYMVPTHVLDISQAKELKYQIIDKETLLGKVELLVSEHGCDYYQNDGEKDLTVVMIDVRRENIQLMSKDYNRDDSSQSPSLTFLLDVLVEEEEDIPAYCPLLCLLTISFKNTINSDSLVQSKRMARFLEIQRCVSVFGSNNQFADFQAFTNQVFLQRIKKVIQQNLFSDDLLNEGYSIPKKIYFDEDVDSKPYAYFPSVESEDAHSWIMFFTTTLQQMILWIRSVQNDLDVAMTPEVHEAVELNTHTKNDASFTASTKNISNSNQDFKHPVQHSEDVFIKLLKMCLETSFPGCTIQKQSINPAAIPFDLYLEWATQTPQILISKKIIFQIQSLKGQLLSIGWVLTFPKDFLLQTNSPRIHYRLQELNMKKSYLTSSCPPNSYDPLFSPSSSVLSDPIYHLSPDFCSIARAIETDQRVFQTYLDSETTYARRIIEYYLTLDYYRTGLYNNDNIAHMEINASQGNPIDVHLPRNSWFEDMALVLKNSKSLFQVMPIQSNKNNTTEIISLIPWTPYHVKMNNLLAIKFDNSNQERYLMIAQCSFLLFGFGCTHTCRDNSMCKRCSLIVSLGALVNEPVNWFLHYQITRYHENIKDDCIKKISI